MFKQIYIFLLVVGVQAVCFAQYTFEEDSFMADSLKTTVSDDSLAQIDPALPLLQMWSLSPKAMLKQEIYLDTLADNMHRFYPGTAQRGLRESLGQIGQPGRSLKLSEQESSFSMPFVQGYSYYFRSHHERKKYHARRPFSIMYYSASSKKEQDFEFFHTQNVSPFFNFGFYINYFNGYGHYRRSSYEGKMLSGFASYEGARLRSYLDINFNNQNQMENGGIEDLSYVSDSLNYAPLAYPPRLFHSGSISDYHDIFIQQEWNLLRPFTSLDSLLGDVDRFKLFLGHEFLYDYAARRFMMDASEDRDKIAVKGRDGTTYSGYDSIKTRDFAIQRTFTEEVYGGFNKRLTKNIILGARGGLGTYFCETRYYEPVAVNHDPSATSTFYTLHFNGKVWGGIAWEANSKQYFEGEKGGDNLLDASIKKELQLFNDTVQLSARFNSNLEQPNALYQQYFGNQMHWISPGLKQTSYQTIRATVKEFTGKYGLSVYSGVRGNHIYWDKNALPQQHADPISELGVSASARFHFWKFVMKNTFTYQTVSVPSVIHIPAFVSENSLYLSLLTFQKRLNVIVGADVNFADSYKMAGYNPATGTFHLQDKELSAMYPLVDLFLNLKLKRMRIFMAYNQISGKIDYWAGPGSSMGVPAMVDKYPYGKPRITYGMSWYFFN